MSGLLDDVCRCGWAGDGPHTCHRCRSEPGTLRRVEPLSAGIEAYMSNACDGCWDGFIANRAQAQARLVGKEAR